MIDVPDQQTEGLSFTAFVLSLASTAAIHFGDLPDPSGERSEPNLVGAAQMIDILALLDRKTRGNLTAEERQQFLKNAEKWAAMSPGERQAWRDLVAQLPMLPSSNVSPPVPRPPPVRSRTTVLATNGG